MLKLDENKLRRSTMKKKEWSLIKFYCQHKQWTDILSKTIAKTSNFNLKTVERLSIQKTIKQFLVTVSINRLFN